MLISFCEPDLGLLFLPLGGGGGAELEGHFDLFWPHFSPVTEMGDDSRRLLKLAFGHFS